jgi:inhibitor of KinA
MKSLEIFPLSERSCTISFGSEINKETLGLVLGFQEVIRKQPFPGFIETVPAYTTLTVYYDPVPLMKSMVLGESPFSKVSDYLRSIDFRSGELSSSSRRHTIPVCYDLQYGPDLKSLSKRLNLSVDEIIQRHSDETYTVFMIGFTPGFPYMGSIDPSLECDRLEIPRKQVPAGSVGIAGKQTGIYPNASPGGWQIVGRTYLELFSVEGNPPALLQAGDQVKFIPISVAEFKAHNS